MPRQPKFLSFSSELSSYIIRRYKETYSVLTVHSEVKEKFDSKMGRKPIEDLLKNEGIYEGLRGDNYLRHRQEKIKKTNKKKYGVENYGQLKTSGFTVSNNIPYKKTRLFGEEYQEYRKKVDSLTKSLSKKIQHPLTCYYTGIEFSDNDKGSNSINPNDPYKKTIDHKKPVLVSYIDGDSPEIAAREDNLVFVLRCINSIKGNTDHNSFKPIAEKVKDYLLDENQNSQTT